MRKHRKQSNQMKIAITQAGLAQPKHEPRTVRLSKPMDHPSTALTQTNTWRLGVDDNSTHVPLTNAQLAKLAKHKRKKRSGALTEADKVNHHILILERERKIAHHNQQSKQ